MSNIDLLLQTVLSALRVAQVVVGLVRTASSENRELNDEELSQVRELQEQSRKELVDALGGQQ